MVEAMVRQWDRTLPLPIAMQRACRFFGLKDPKKRRSTAVRTQLTADSLKKLAGMMPLIPAEALPKIIDFEEYKTLRGIEHG